MAAEYADIYLSVLSVCAFSLHIHMSILLQYLYLYALDQNSLRKKILIVLQEYHTLESAPTGGRAARLIHTLLSWPAEGYLYFDYKFKFFPDHKNCFYIHMYYKGYIKNKRVL